VSWVKHSDLSQPYCFALLGNAAACAAGFWGRLHSLLGVKKVVSEDVRELTHRGRNSGQYASGRFYECPTIGLVLPIAVI